MPTGYTAGVQDGTITTFREFALRCGRAMGACADMRDENRDVPPPQEIQASTYAADRIIELTAQLQEAELMSPDQAADEALKTYQESYANWEKSKAKKERCLARYEAMLAKAKAWTPPSPAHEDFKRFMIQQLTESIGWDCSTTYDTPPQRLTGPAWLKQRLEWFRRDIDNYKRNVADENERVAKYNLWLKQFHEALAEIKD